MELADSSVGPIADRVGAMGITEEPTVTAATEAAEATEATEDEATEHEPLRQKSTKRAKPTRVLIFTPEDLLRLTTGLQNYEKTILQKLESLTAPHLSLKNREEGKIDVSLSLEGENNRCYLETELKNVRFYLDKAASEKELIAPYL